MRLAANTRYQETWVSDRIDADGKKSFTISFGKGMPEAVWQFTCLSSRIAFDEIEALYGELSHVLEALKILEKTCFNKESLPQERLVAEARANKALARWSKLINHIVDGQQVPTQAIQSLREVEQECQRLLVQLIFQEGAQQEVLTASHQLFALLQSMVKDKVLQVDIQEPDTLSLAEVENKVLSGPGNGEPSMTGLNSGDVAVALGISDDTVRRHIQRGRLQATRQGENGRYAISVESLSQYARANGYDLNEVQQRLKKRLGRRVDLT